MLSDAAEATLVKLQRIYDPPGARTEARGAFYALRAQVPSPPTAQGPAIREAQRHLAQWTLSPIASIIAQEASEKLGGSIAIDVMGPLQAFDAGSLSRVFSTVVRARQG
jgi:hypothetical protein